MAKYLSIDDALKNKDEPMMLEKNRLKSFARGWIFSEGVCSKENLAKAGFYHASPEVGGDSVRCFCCFKELEGWEQSDDPWAEHLSHQSECLFAQLRKEESQLTVSEMVKIAEQRALNRNKKLKVLRLNDANRRLEE
ncbi:Baculoviral IAP repeat-containing protein 5 [Halotydeus destructor]|nr:Baculoviral IAP repeat-containing protein 5 [Halotydeus destructor]